MCPRKGDLRRPMQLASLASLAFLAIMTLGAWSFSYFRGIEIAYMWKDASAVDFGNFSGFFRIIISRPRTDRPPRPSEFGQVGFMYVFPPASVLRPNRFYRPGTFLGFSYCDAFPIRARSPRIRTWWFPDWFAVLLVSAPAILLGRPLLIERRRNRLVMKGLCPNCGYDLRGAEVGASSDRRCPECGLVSSISPKSPER